MPEIEMSHIKLSVKNVLFAVIESPLKLVTYLLPHFCEITAKNIESPAASFFNNVQFMICLSSGCHSSTKTSRPTDVADVALRKSITNKQVRPEPIEAQMRAHMSMKMIKSVCFTS